MFLKTKTSKLKPVLGFTILETLIYAGLVSLMLAFMVVSVYQMIDSRDRLKFQRELVENQKFLNQKLAWLLQSNSAINTPAVGASGASLSVNKIGASDNPYVMIFGGGKITLTTGVNSAVGLTNNYVTVNNAFFENLNLGNRAGLRFHAELSNAFASTTVETTYAID